MYSTFIFNNQKMSFSSPFSKLSFQQFLLEDLLSRKNKLIELAIWSCRFVTETDKEHVVRNIKTKNFDIHFSWYPFTGDIFYNNKVNIEHRSSQSEAVPINARVYIEAPNFKFTAFTISFSSLHMCTSGTVCQQCIILFITSLLFMSLYLYT